MQGKLQHSHISEKHYTQHFALFAFSRAEEKVPCSGAAQRGGQQLGTSHQLGDTIKQVECLMHRDEELFIHIPHKKSFMLWEALKTLKVCVMVW